MNSHLYRKKTIERINNKLKLLNSNYNALFILNIRLLLSLIILILVVPFFDVGIVLGPILAIIFYYLFEYLFIDLKVINRKKKINEESLPFFEILLISLKKDSLLQSLLNVSSSMESEIALDFRQVVKEVAMGQSLNKSLNSLKERIPSSEIKLMIASLQNTNMVNLEKDLEEQIRILKEKNKLQRNYNISLVPIKINLITIFFVIIFILLIVYQLSILNLC